jgi:serine/threonine-protein kinase
VSPEQARGEPIDARTVDETLDRVIDAAPKPVEKVRTETPLALAQIVRKAMAQQPGERYQKASEMRNALAEFVDGSRPASVDPAAQSVPATPAAPPARGPMLFGVALIALLGVGGVALFMNHQAQAPTTPRVPAAPQAVPAMPAPPPAPEATAPAPPTVEAEPPKAEAKSAPRRKSEAAPPTGDGTVVVAVTPWGEVVVDGRVQGVSPPLTQVTLPPGTHTIEIRNGSSPPFVAQVEVKPGEKIQVQHRF